MVARVRAIWLAFFLGAFLGPSTGQYSPDLITSLPGLPEMPAFQQWSGYLQAGPGQYFHYWFVESQGNPSTDPLVLWLNGGPGCSSMEGFLAENGPFHLNSDGTLYLNPSSWNQVANMLYIESPAGVGYSYSTSEDTTIDDSQVAEDNYQALQSFFAKFPNFANNPFYVFGESYGGIFVPSLTSKIAEGSASINLKGFGVGNGMLSYALNELTLMEFGYYHGVFGDEYSEAYGVLLWDWPQHIQPLCVLLGRSTLPGPFEADLSNLFRQYQFNVPVPVSCKQAEVTSENNVGSIPGVPPCINAHGHAPRCCSGFQPWYYNDQVAGFFKEYEKITLPHCEGCDTWYLSTSPAGSERCLNAPLATSYV
ncbi:lysosomal protective protein-like [Sceloporus undulatus]|uniref:lysosomal protective protein-like n=1 Tax=Sceloporus undulatus TaxID=8520 RepID=UPI001C4A7865|nr:lysosomal protective protein-like [Sceloporus undulatus]